MNRPYPILAFLLLVSAATLLYGKIHERETASGITYGVDASDKVAFHGAAPIAQATLTDSTTGTAGTALAAGVGVTTVAIPIQLASMTTSAADLITNYTPGYKFKVLSASFVTTTLGTGSGASQVLNLEIGSTNITGGVVTVTLASTDTLGEISAGTSVTAANTGSATDTLSVEVAASGTVFTAGAGVLLLQIQNMDSADAFATLRAVLANKGLVGS